MLKRLLNLSEQMTHVRLKELCEANKASVFSKVRLKDVLPVDNSGISSEEYGFSLKSHLDFVVVDEDSLPQFAVEFDGPTHTTLKQKSLDAIKDKLCRQFGLPLLRITSDFLTQPYRGMDLLSWFVDVWFMQQDFDRQQKAGVIPFDEVFDPFAVIASEGKDERFPYWLSAPLLIQLRKHHTEGNCSDPICYHIIGLDDEDNYYGIGWLYVTDNLAISSTISAKGQNFPVLLGELVSELLVYELYKSFTALMDGQRCGVPLEDLNKQISIFKQHYKTASTLTRGSFDDY